MAYEIYLESSDEKYAPPEQKLLRVSLTPAGNGYPSVIHLDVVETEEDSMERSSYLIKEGISVDADEFLRALVAVAPGDRT